MGPPTTTTIDRGSSQVATLRVRDRDETRLMVEDLDDWQRLTVLKSTGALHGTRLDSLLRGAMSASHRTPLTFTTPARDGWWRPGSRSESRATLDWSSSTHRARSQGFFSAEIDGSYAFCPASVAASHASASLARTAVRRTYLTGYWRVPTAVVSLPGCTTVSPDFVEAAREALRYTGEARYSALQQLFADYGHVYHPTLVLGGVAYFQTSRIASATSRQQDVRTTVAAAVEHKATGGTGASGKAGFQTADGSEETGQEIAESVTWTMIGGRPEHEGDVARWLPSVDDAQRWQLVDREGSAVPTLSLLPEDLQVAVRSAWKEGLRQTWRVTDDTQVPSSTAYPHFRGRPVVLRTSHQLDPARQRVLRARPEPASSDDDGALARAHPARLNGAEAAFPEKNHLYWRFAYARSHSDGVPHYRIVSRDGAHALTTVREGDGTRHVILVTVAAAALDDRAALWMVHAADPGQRFGDTFAGEWLLQQVGSGWFVGRQETGGEGTVRTVLRDVSGGLRAGWMKPGAPAPWDLRDYCWRIYDPLDTGWPG